MKIFQSEESFSAIKGKRGYLMFVSEKEMTLLSIATIAALESAPEKFHRKLSKMASRLLESVARGVTMTFDDVETRKVNPESTDKCD